jgi:hypothetical protein
VLFTFDEDFLGEAARRQQERQTFAGIVYAHPCPNAPSRRQGPHAKRLTAKG